MAVTLNARSRATFGKNAARKLRSAGHVPAVIYGHGDETRPLEIAVNELERLLSHISMGNTLIDLRVEGAKATSALIREVQYHAVKPMILHVDFLQVHAGEKIHLRVPVRLHGTPVGVRDEQGVLQEVLHELDVECLPRDIPEGIDIDVEALGIGDSVHVRDVTIANVTILNDPELTIASVTNPTVEAVAEPEADEAADAQPELVKDRRREGDDSE
ncbi:MAG: 50S ribosomal protein L25 [Gemmatimonadetes bacterium]|nr:50S ribosomal protein L25 [Gemmatimonadota bacterium]